MVLLKVTSVAFFYEREKILQALVIMITTRNNGQLLIIDRID